MKVDRRWEYEARPEDETSTLVIVKIARLNKKIDVYFADIDHIQLKGELSSRMFVPLTEEALRKSVTRPVGSNEAVSHLDEQHDDWSQNVGTSFQLPFSNLVVHAVRSLTKRVR